MAKEQYPAIKASKYGELGLTEAMLRYLMERLPKPEIDRASDEEMAIYEEINLYLYHLGD